MPGVRDVCTFPLWYHSSSHWLMQGKGGVGGGNGGGVGEVEVGEVEVVVGGLLTHFRFLSHHIMSGVIQNKNKNGVLQTCPSHSHSSLQVISASTPITCIT